MDRGTNRLSEVVTFSLPNERIENGMKEQELKEHLSDKHRLEQ